MGFFQLGNKAATNTVSGISLDLLHRSECALCPLNAIKTNKHPHMKPSGTSRPLVYMLGEAPGRQEDKEGEAFVGETGQILRFRIPDEWNGDLRWSNCVRTRPPDNRTPTLIEVECCRPSVIRDVEATKPVAIFGFGNVPLHWAIRQEGITKWRGRRIPIKVGTHACWFYPMWHPSYINHMRKFDPRHVDEYGSEFEFAFAKDLERAFAEVDAGLPEPIVHTIDMAMQGIDYVTGENGSADVTRILDFIDSCYDEDAVGHDYETNRLRVFSEGAKILTTALATRDKALAWPVRHREAIWSDAEFDVIDEAFEEFLHTAPCRKISFSLPFEQEWSAHFYGKECLRSSKWGDAQQQAYVLDQRKGTLSLDFQCLQYFGFDLKAISNVDRSKLDETPVETVLKYNALDAKYHLALWDVQGDRLGDMGMTKVYEHQERRVPTMVLTSMQGVPLNQKAVAKFEAKYSGQEQDIEGEIDAMPIVRKFRQRMGYHYRPSAPKDVFYMFCDLLGYDLENATEEALEAIDHPLAQLTVDWRKAHKVLSTYVLPCVPDSETSVVFPDGLLHPTIALHKTRTNRTSCDGPNTQNFPKYGLEGKEVRAMVAKIAEAAERARGIDYKVVSFDYAGIQARNIAMESLDKGLIDAFWKRYDIHTDWMERIHRRHPRWVSKADLNDKDKRKEIRHLAKNRFVLPSFFGAQPKSIGANLGIPEVCVEDLQDDLFGMFPQIKAWHKRLKKQYLKLGYTTGLSGFRRYAPVSPNELINTPIQSDEAIIVCDAMNRLSEREEPAFQATLEIHDDLTFIWPKKDIERNAEVVIDYMLDVPFEWAHVVPIEVEMSVGDDWASTKEVGAYASDTWKGRLERKAA